MRYDAENVVHDACKVAMSVGRLRTSSTTVDE